MALQPFNIGTIGLVIAVGTQLAIQRQGCGQRRGNKVVAQLFEPSTRTCKRLLCFGLWASKYHSANIRQLLAMVDMQQGLGQIKAEIRAVVVAIDYRWQLFEAGDQVIGEDTAKE